MSASPPLSPIRVSFRDLRNDPIYLNYTVAQAFGPEAGCLGIILIDNLPLEFAGLRQRLFFLAHGFANLPEAVREDLSRPESLYSFGWSHGKEVMNGRPDTMKGSYYANPQIDHPDVPDRLRASHPEYYSGNVWPDNISGMEEFESTFKALGKIVYDVGIALARACESFVLAASPGRSKSLESLITQSRCNKARLLHYYPESPLSSGSEKIANDALCGTHVDHSLLTGLCSAMYLSQSDSSPSLSVMSPPSNTAGLYIHPRHSSLRHRPQAVKVEIPEDCLAFQTGEALELLTAGKLAATPHFVSGNAAPSPDASEVSRETFAFFLQPDVEDVISVDGEKFGAFTKRVLGRHYGEKAVREAEN